MYKICGHDAQVQILDMDLARAMRHPIFERHPKGNKSSSLISSHSDLTEEQLSKVSRSRIPLGDICALGRSGGTELFHVTICHPLSQARIRDVSENPMNLLKAAWTAKVSRYSGMLQAAGTRFNLLPVPLSTLGGWHPDGHKA